jgi:hypothetical protein
VKDYLVTKIERKFLKKTDDKRLTKEMYEAELDCYFIRERPRRMNLDKIERVLEKYIRIPT